MDVSTYVVVEVPRKITQVVTKVAMTKQHEPSKIVGEDFPVDILWLFESGLEGSPHSLHKAKPEDETMLWDVVQVKYQMPHAGVWDTDPYMQARDMTKPNDANKEMEYITVGLLKNDPRLSFILQNIQDQQKELNNNNNSNSVTTYSNSSFDTNGDALIHAMQCNIMHGYSGRLCRTCLPGFAKVGNKCERCPPYAVCVVKLVGSFVIAIVATIVMVLLVMADAGSTSTSSSLKRILLNHMQTIAMLLHFDLDWPPETTGFFSWMGAISSIGDDLIQTSCILNAQELTVQPFYITQIMFILLPCVLLLPGSIFLWIQYGCCCGCKPKETSTKVMDTQKRIAELKRIREVQAHSDTTAEEEAELRASYNHVLDELRTSGVEDFESASIYLADSSAVARLRARDFMEFVRRNNIDLKKYFSEFDETNLGSIKVSDFILIVKSLGLDWSADDYICVAGLFGNRSAKNRNNDGRVSLAKIMSYGKTYNDRWIVMFLTICYLLYPTIARKIFTTLSCRSGLMEGDYTSYLWDDLNISCTSPGHISFIIFVALPGLIFYVFGFPIITLYNLRKRLKEHGWTNDTTMFRYAVIVSGYTHKRWYWELVICARKVLLTMTAVFLKNYGPERQFIFANLVLMVAMMLQVRERPFSNNELNNLENWSLGILFLTLYLGLFFFWDLVQGTGRTLMGLSIIGFNILYILWLSGSLFREYLARHQSKKTQWLAHKCHTKNPIVLCILAVPCFVLLVCIKTFDMLMYPVRFCCESNAKKQNKSKPLSQVIPQNLLKRQKMQWKEAIHHHVAHAKIKLKTLKTVKQSKLDSDIHKMKLVRAHSKSTSRLMKRLEKRGDKVAAAEYRKNRDIEQEKLFGQELITRSETMDKAGLLDMSASERSKKRDKKGFKHVVHKVKVANDAKLLVDTHTETLQIKKRNSVKQKRGSNMRLMKRLAKKNIQAAHTFKKSVLERERAASGENEIEMVATGED